MHEKMKGNSAIYNCLQITEMEKWCKYEPSSKLVVIDYKIRFTIYLY